MTQPRTEEEAIARLRELHRKIDVLADEAMLLHLSAKLPPSLCSKAEETHGYLRSTLSDCDIPYAIKMQARRDRDEDGDEEPYGRMSRHSDENHAGICEHIRNAAE